MKKQRTSSIDLKRAASICCQCNTCTDLCPRNNLGHPIDPARFMRAAANGDFRDLNPYLDSHFCSSCGVCEMYACPQSLAPRTLLADMKGGLRKAGIRPAQGVQPVPVQQSREYRKVPEERLMARLGLTKYDKAVSYTHLDVYKRQGEGLTSASTFTKRRRCVMSDSLCIR